MDLLNQFFSFFKLSKSFIELTSVSNCCLLTINFIFYFVFGIYYIYNNKYTIYENNYNRNPIGVNR